ncbi:MAG: hypothetical protein AAFX99_27540, partial [Myxococcota bacterium]
SIARHEGADRLFDGGIGRHLILDVRTLGNHDFAWSVAHTLACSQDPHADVLCANVAYTGPDGPDAWNAKSWTVKILDGIRVGFVGLVAHPWNEHNEPELGDYYPEMPTRLDYQAVVAEVLDKHAHEADLIVLLSHLGLGRDRDMAARFKAINVILGAHSHDAITEVTPSGTIILQTGKSGHYIGRLDLYIDRKTKTIHHHHCALVNNIKDQVPADPAIEQTVRTLMARYAPEALTTIGHAMYSANKADVAALTAQAALKICGDIDAALIHTKAVFEPWAQGPLCPQTLLDAFKVERQPAGTPGWTSVYTVRLSGTMLARLRDETDPMRWHFAGPDTLVPSATYVLMTQKYAALHPERYFPTGVTVTDPAPYAETWELLDTYARQQTRAGLPFDHLLVQTAGAA